MPNNSSTGLSLADAHAKNLEGVTDPPSTPVSEETEDVLEETSDEQPVEKSEDGEDVDLLSELDDDKTNEEEEGEQPQIEDSTQFTVDGRPVTFEELKSGYLRQSDYTQKTQELAQQREEVKNAVSLWDALQEDFDGTLKQLQGAMRNPVQRLTPQGTTPAPPVPTDEVDVDALVEERFKNDPRVQELEQKAYEAEESTQFAALEEQYGRKITDKDKQRVRDEMETLGLKNPAAIGVVFGGLYQKAQAKAKAKKSLATSAPQRSRSGEPESPTAPKERPQSIAEAFAMEQAAKAL